MDNNLERDLKDFIRKEFLFDRPDTDLSNDLSLIESGIIDSLGIFTLISHLEDAFGVQIQPEDVVIENFETIDSIKKMIAERRG